jgi:hypothetical protein
MNIIGNRTTFIMNTLTFCAASGVIVERSWIYQKVYGDYTVNHTAALLFPVAISFMLRSRTVSIILFCLHGPLFAEMTYLARAAYVGDERVSYVSSSNVAFTAVLWLSMCVVGFYLLASVLVRIFGTKE